MEELYAIGYVILATGVAGVLYIFGKVLWTGFKAVKHNDD